MFSASQERYMEPDKVRNISRGFGTAAAVLKVVSATLELQMMILRTTAFIGAVGGLAVERYLARIKPQIDMLAKKCDEMSQEIERSVRMWEAAQQDG